MNSNAGRMSRGRYPPNGKSAAPFAVCFAMSHKESEFSHAAEGAALFRPTCNL
jgi:hypothetical protein